MTGFYKLLHLANVLAKACDTRLGETLGLSFSSAQALMYLADHDDARQSELAGALGVTPAVITRHVVNLQARGLIKQAQNADNRRQNDLVITPSGRKLAIQAREVVTGVSSVVRDSLDATALEIFTQSLAKIEERLK